MEDLVIVRIEIQGFDDKDKLLSLQKSVSKLECKSLADARFLCDYVGKSVTNELAYFVDKMLAKEAGHKDPSTYVSSMVDEIAILKRKLLKHGIPF